LVAAAVCPFPPLLVPGVGAGATGELDELRAACDTAVAELLAAEPDRIATIGAGPEPSGAEVGRPDLPLSLAIGVWLLGRHGLAESPAAGQVVAADTPPAECARLGATYAAEARRVALLVLGDGTACRSPKAPGYLDPRAEPYDATAARALAQADAAAVLALDPGLAQELRCAGRAPWQVLAGAVIADGRRWHGRLYYDDAPYGVAYFVATWHPSPSSTPPTPPIMNRGS